MSTQNRGLIYNGVPNGMPVPGKDLKIIDRPIDLNAAPADGGLLVKNHYFSYDPYQRGRMRDPSVKSYSAPYELNKPITNSGICTVLKSSNSAYKEGDTVEVWMSCPMEEYSVLAADHVNSAVSKLNNPHGVATEHFLHSLGMPGLTAYSGLYEIGGPLKAGETIFISSAAGAVGQVVGQIAKRNGLKVIGSVGNDEKLNFLIKECGFDGGFNYKSEKAADALARLAPNGLDIYWENVGGEQLEAAINKMNDWGRIICCGMVSQYNLKPQEMYPIRNLMAVVRSRIKMQGFIVNDPGFRDKWAKEHQENVTKWISEGSFKPKIDVTDGIDKGAEGFVHMLEGKNFGKAVLKV